MNENLELTVVRWQFPKHPLHDAGSNAQLLADLVNAVAFGSQL